MDEESQVRAFHSSLSSIHHNPPSIRYIDQVLYLCPVTDVRLPGSKRRVMEMLKSLTRAGRQLNGEGGYDNEGAVTLITTMWDMVWNDRVKERADQNYIQLKEQIWKVRTRVY